jgi:hypothetical protein
MTTYKNDPSFFICVKTPPSTYTGIREITQWFKREDISKYRLIVDYDFDKDFVGLKDREDMYPGILSIVSTINPWARAALTYKELKTLTNPFSRHAEGTFNEFVENLVKIRDSGDMAEQHMMNQQCTFYQYVDENGDTKTPTYTFAVENLDKEFKVIQDYFETTAPIVWFSKIPKGYKDVYTTKTKKLIAELYKDDIEIYKYKY